ncbi:MAG: hydroxysqualene dehydroxylase HpnE [Inhella sp.]|uniref:hydroxysqualene dehydroxylase HpnE n=1 Tax=Inhella sp. TaxID=1921806 RepID=UPI00391FA109
MKPRVLVIGGGWAGLAAAVHAVRRGAEVQLWEMAPLLGGRARAWCDADGHWHDSGQHILIGAYRETLALMATVGAAPALCLHRLPLMLVDPQGQGLRWPRTRAPAWAAALAVARHPRWRWREHLGLALWTLGLLARGLRAPAAWSVERLCRGLPLAVRQDLIDPLCIAALNTRTEEASAAVLLRVLRDALLGGRGGSDLLLPAAPLHALLPGPAAAWLQAHGAKVHTGRRALQLTPQGSGWVCDGQAHDRVVLACSATEASRLTRGFAPDWAAAAAALPAEAIATVELHAEGAALAAPMVALSGGPAQFLFDLGGIDGPGSPRQGRFTAVASAVAQELAVDGLEAVAARIAAQVRAQVPALAQAVQAQAHADKRATFACRAALQRPRMAIAPGLWAAGDYVDGPYPATLEGAVQAGQRAAQAALTHNRRP